MKNQNPVMEDAGLLWSAIYDLLEKGSKAMGIACSNPLLFSMKEFIGVWRMNSAALETIRKNAVAHSGKSLDMRFFLPIMKEVFAHENDGCA